MVRDAVEVVVKALLDNKDYLTGLDAKIGDGDHGLNMARGANAVIDELDELEDEDAENLKLVLEKVGDAVIMNVGGTSGPLYGTGFLEIAKVIDEDSELNPDTLAKVFGAAIAGIQRRGRAEKGDKTMLDVLIPVCETFKSDRIAGKKFGDVLTMARDAARDGVAFTKSVAAKKGRASYLGEKSIGFEDPGAVSSLIICSALFAYWKDNL